MEQLRNINGRGSELKDSGKRQDFETGAVRDAAEDKSRPDLVSPYFMERIGDHLDKGARKYSERNWEMGIPISRCIASLERHLMQYKMGLVDEDHLAAIACNIMFTIHYEEMIKRNLLPDKLDDLPRYEFQIENNKEATNENESAKTEAESCVLLNTNHVVGGFVAGLCNCEICRSLRGKSELPKAGEPEGSTADSS